MRPLKQVLFGVIAAGAALASAACSAGDEDAPELVGRTFLSESVTENGADRPLVAGTRIRLGFPSAEELTAHAGCNHMSGRIASLGGGRLVVSEISSTLMGCEPELHEQDDWLQGFLRDEPSWALEGYDLVLSTSTTVIALLDRVVADPDRPLESTRWVVDTLLAGDAASSVPGDAEADMRFSEGTVSGSTGCNAFSGDYAVEGRTLHFSGFIATEKACEPDVMLLEHAVLALDGTSVQYTITARRLTLEAPDGTGLGLHAAD